MKPNHSFITIHNNPTLIKEFLNDLIIKPRVDIHKWSEITKQTPTLKIGYVGQHLASLITGMEGGRTGARGHDIRDGTEVKSCTKVDQADKCKNCAERVMRAEKVCSNCGSDEIERKDDSKWLFSVKTEDELNQLTQEIGRVFLLISDYPNFKQGDFSDIRFEAFEIYPQNPRMSIFVGLLIDYYHNNYKPKADANRTTAPMNFHPYKFQFYMCNPIKVFSCTINNIDSNNPTISITHYVQPDTERTHLESEKMPIEILRKNELLSFVDKAPFKEIVKPLLVNKKQTKEEVLDELKKSKKDDWKNIIPHINEAGRRYLDMRDIVISPQNTTYRRS